MQGQGHRVFIASTGHYEGVKSYCFFAYKLIPFFPFHNFYLSRFLSDVIRKEKIDIIHAHDRLTSIPSILAAEREGIPSVVHFRDYWFACPRSSCMGPRLSEYDRCSFSIIFREYPFYRWPLDLYKWLYLRSVPKILNRATVKVANSNAILRRLKANGIIRNVHVVGIFRDFSFFPKATSYDFLSFPLKKKVLTFLGGLTYTKGILFVLRSLLSVLHERDDTSFLIVGHGPLEKAIRDFILENNISDKIFLSSSVSLDSITEIYRRSDIVVLPSLWQEPFSGVILEAGLMKKPVVASAVGGNVEVILDGKTGFLVSPNDSSLWRERISYLLDNPSICRKIGEAAFRHIKNNFSREVITKKIEGLYLSANVG